MVDLKANPYYLSDEDCKWVEETIASMTPEEKVGQLFFQLTSSQEEEYLKELMEKYHLGGCRYNPMPGKKVQEQNRILQKYAKVPVFIACNTEAGGDGACADGTPIGAGVKIAATDNEDYAHALGKCPTQRRQRSAVTWRLRRSVTSHITGRIPRSSRERSEMIQSVLRR